MLQGVLFETIVRWLIVGVAVVVLLWLLRAGPARPRLAYTAPFAVAFPLLLALFFGLFGVIGLITGEGPLGQTLTLLVGAVGMGYCAVEGIYYRLRWDDDGFQVRRLMGKSFTATWTQVRGAGPLDNLEYRIVLTHPTVSKVSISTYLVGANEFIRTLRQKTGRGP